MAPRQPPVQNRLYRVIPLALLTRSSTNAPQRGQNSGSSSTSVPDSLLCWHAVQCFVSGSTSSLSGSIGWRQMAHNTAVCQSPSSSSLSLSQASRPTALQAVHVMSGVYSGSSASTIAASGSLSLRNCPTRRNRATRSSNPAIVLKLHRRHESTLRSMGGQSLGRLEIVRKRPGIHHGTLKKIPNSPWGGLLIALRYYLSTCEAFPTHSRSQLTILVAQ